jgi:hypothetical protein
MKKTWKPTTSGILSIIAGFVGVIAGIVVAVLGEIIPMLHPMPEIGVALNLIATIMILLGIVAIVGGIYAIRRKIWWLALAGSICAVICAWPLGTWILGIPAIIFAAMGKSEFR